MASQGAILEVYCLECHLWPSSIQPNMEPCDERNIPLDLKEDNGSDPKTVLVLKCGIVPAFPSSSAYATAWFTLSVHW